jgi:hypothetical protein
VIDEVARRADGLTGRAEAAGCRARTRTAQTSRRAALIFVPFCSKMGGYGYATTWRIRDAWGFKSPLGHKRQAYLLDLTYRWSNPFNHPIGVLTLRLTAANRRWGWSS